MHFDDRLATVLRNRAGGARAARTQFRQLLDLLGERPQARDDNLLVTAWLRLAALSETIPARDRAAMLREGGWRFRNPELAAHLAEDEPEVASAALERAQLTGAEWVELIPKLPVRARGFLRLHRNLPDEAERVLNRLGIHDRGLPNPAVGSVGDGTAGPDTSLQVDTDLAPADNGGSDDDGDVPFLLNDEAPASDEPWVQREPAAEAKPTAASSAGDRDEISAIVARIEAFRRARKEQAAPTEASARPTSAPASTADNELAIGGPALAHFAFTADTSGRIDWAEPGIDRHVVGLPLLDPTERADLGERHPLVLALRHRLPIRRVRRQLTGAARIAGEWLIDAAPQFSEADGAFEGFVGRFRRIANDVAETRSQAAQAQADRMRQLLHELKTPVNAIQGFAEVIQQQLFGTTPHHYRALAASIAGDSAQMLSGFDDLDRLARLDSGALEMGEGVCDLGEVILPFTQQLQAVLKPRLAKMILLAQAGQHPVALPRGEADDLSWRILATLAGGAQPGENLQVELQSDDDRVMLAADLPKSIAAEDDIFATDLPHDDGPVSAGIFGPGFALRLARSEARAAGGKLERDAVQIRLTLPRADVTLLGDAEAAA